MKQFRITNDPFVWTSVGLLVSVGGGMIGYAVQNWLLDDWVRIGMIVYGSIAFVGGVVIAFRNVEV